MAQRPRARPMRFVRLDTGCVVCISHRPNQDGYLRKTWGNSRSSSRIAEMFHRFIYRAHSGDIPAGWEVHHTCGVRPCCEPTHLVVMPGEDHAVETNTNRFRLRKEKAKELWACGGMSGTALAKEVGVSVSAACGWIRSWRR